MLRTDVKAVSAEIKVIYDRTNAQYGTNEQPSQ